MRVRQVKKFTGGKCQRCGSTRVVDVRWHKGVHRQDGETAGRTLLRAECESGHVREVAQDADWKALAQNSPGTAKRTVARVKLDRARQQGAKPKPREPQPTPTPTPDERPRRAEGHRR